MGSRSKLTFGTIVLAMTCTIGAAAAEQFVPRAVDWALVVKPVNKAGTSYWVGLRNGAKEARAFCMFGLMYEFDLRNGDTIGDSVKSVPMVGSPHRCAREMAHLLLPGETYFVWVDVVIPADADPARRVRFEGAAEEACVDANACPRIAIYVTEPRE